MNFFKGLGADFGACSACNGNINFLPVTCHDASGNTHDHNAHVILCIIKWSCNLKRCSEMYILQKGTRLTLAYSHRKGGDFVKSICHRHFPYLPATRFPESTGQRYLCSCCSIYQCTQRAFFRASFSSRAPFKACVHVFCNVNFIDNEQIRVCDAGFALAWDFISLCNNKLRKSSPYTV